MTVTQIAQLANVSIATVDRVLHNRGRVALETKARIEKIIKDSGYQPDPLARHLKNKTQYKFGILIPEILSSFGYWELIYSGIKNTLVQEFSAFSLTEQTFFFKRTDSASLKLAFEQMVNADCNAYIIAPVLENEIKQLLAIYKVRKPYCFLDSSIPDCNPICEIVQNPWKAGYLAGRLTKLLTIRNGTFIVLKSFTGAYNLDERAFGFCDWFSQNSSTPNRAISITQKLSPDTVEEYVRNLVNRYPDLCGICSVSTEVSLLAKAVQNLGLKKDIVITGFDVVEENKEYLLRGQIDALIDQKPYEQGSLAVRQLFKKLVYNEPIEKQINMPIEIILKENV